MSGKSIKFNGKDSEVFIKNEKFYSALPLTIQCWIKTTQNKDENCAMINKYINGSKDGWALNIKNGKISFWILNGENGCDYGGTKFVSDGLWHNIIVTVSNEKSKIYVDGVLDKEVTSGINAPNKNGTDIIFGWYQGSSGRYEGLLDEVAFWKSELSGAEIAKYAKGSGIDRHDKRLIGYWNCDKIVSGEILDIVNKNNGIVKKVELSPDACPASAKNDYRYLIKSRNEYYSFKSFLYNIDKDGVNDSVFKEYGFDDLVWLTEKQTKGVLKMDESNKLKKGKQFKCSFLNHKIKKINTVIINK